MLHPYHADMFNRAIELNSYVLASPRGNLRLHRVLEITEKTIKITEARYKAGTQYRVLPSDVYVLPPEDILVAKFTMKLAKP